MRGNSDARSRLLSIHRSTARLTVCALCTVVVSTGLAIGAATLNPVGSGAASGAAIGIQKSADVTGYSSAGTPIIYSYVVTNTGRVTLTSVSVTDGMPGLSEVSCPESTLAVAASETCTATYTTTQADVDAGKLKNTGVATGTPPTGPKVTDSSSLTIPAHQSASIGIEKSADITDFSAPGALVGYSYAVTNLGNVTLNSVGVTDAMPGLSAVTCPTTTLAPAADETCTASYTTTQADVDAGGITNTGIAMGTPEVGPTVTSTSTLTVAATQTPSIGIVKSADVASFSAPGVPITYSYVVTNTGNLTLTSVGVSDPMAGLSPVSCPDASLAPGADETCTATYTTTQGDVDAGGITNTGTATGTPPAESDEADVTASDSLTVPANQRPSIAVVKSADVSSFSAPDTPITYSYLVTNTGNVTLTSVGVSDPMAGLSPVSCPDATLGPAADETCTATYSTTQADVDAGGITNTGTATGTPPVGSNVSDSSSLTVPAVQTPSVGIVKTASISSFSTPGVSITYSYKVTNTGNVTLTSVDVTDPLRGLSAVSCPDPTLAPAATETCTATYTTTQANVDAGGIHNTGTATGTPPSGPDVTAKASLFIRAHQHPSIGIVKSADVANFDAPATLITYSYAVTNTGNVTLTSIDVTDPMAGLSAVSCPSATLAPAASETCTATYTTTQADVDAGGITNTGTATATPPHGAGVTASDSLTVAAVQSPAITIFKSSSISSFAAPNTLITYSYLVTNTGNVTLTSVGVGDPMPGLSVVSCPTATLAPTDSETCTATYTTTQANVDAGSITNTGTATGSPPTGPAVTASDSVDIPAIESPSIGIVKSASIANFSSAGTPITYSYEVTNSGNVTLHSVHVTDPMPGLSAVNCPTATLAPAADETCTASYTTTQADVDAGGITNTGTATGTPPSGPDVVYSSQLTVPAEQSPSVGIVKSADVASFSSAGTPITYSYEVTNSGNVTLHSVHVTDPMPGLSAVTCPHTDLAPAADETCTATYTTTQADVDAGSITNTGTATGTPPSGPEVMAGDSLTVPANQSPSIGVVKSASVSSFAAATTPITYYYVVSNTGNVTLTSVGVTDSMAGLSAVTCPDATLAPAASETCSADYTTTQADVDAGGITNTGTATGTPLIGPEVTANDSLTVPAVQSPSIGLTKSADVVSFASANTSITYYYVVTNTGNVTLTSIGVTDPMPGLSAVTCPTGTLAPGSDETCAADYTTTQADVDAGGITNTGTASGTPPSGPPVIESSSLTVPSSQSPSIAVVKSANVSGFSAPGTLITYSYEVTNTGNKTLTSVHVTDPMAGLSAVTCPDATLAPAAYETCSADYTTTQADVDAGGIANTGTATGTPPSGPDVTATNSITVPAVQSPSIEIAKSASISSYSGAGTPVTYSYKVTNNGNVTLTSADVTDPMAGLSVVTCPTATLAPGSAETCTADYTTTQADVDNGSITNTGTATAMPPSGPGVTADDSVTIRAVRSASIKVVKSASVSSFSGPGTPITYSYAVTNTGNVTLTSASVTDPMPGLSPVSCPSSPLAPATTETCIATYTTTVGNVDAGKIANTGTATGTPPSGPTVSDASSLTIPFRAPSCYVGPWPAKVSGYPVFSHWYGHTPEGYYTGEVNNTWTMHVSHPSFDLLVMSGTIVTNGRFTDVQRLMDEYNDVVHLIGNNEISFSFHNYGGLDGVGFTSTCGSQVTIKNFEVGGKPAPLDDIHLGSPTTHATTNPETFTRKY